MPRSLTARAGRPLRGEVAVAADKSISHRAVILASLARGRTRLRNLSQGADVRATVAAMRAMGVRIDESGDACATVTGVGLHGLRAPAGALDMGNSGTAMRLLAGLLSAQPWGATLTGDESLSARPMARIIAPLREMGARIESAAGGRPPLVIRPAAGLRGIDYRMPVASAQVKSALLLAGLYASGATTVTAPAATRDHTERMLAAFGAPVFGDALRAGVRGGGAELRAGDGDGEGHGDGHGDAASAGDGHGEGDGDGHGDGHGDGDSDCALALTVPGDLSAAAFFLVGASIIPGSDITVTSIGVNPTRAGVVKILRRMGADLELQNRREVSGEMVADIRARAARLRGVRLGAQEVALAVDEIPVIAVAAAAASGTTTIRGAAELRVKESDRLSAVAAGLHALGVTVDEHDDGLTIHGRGGEFGAGDGDGAGDGADAGAGAGTAPPFRAGTVESRGDHRIAMAFAIAGGAAAGPVTVLDCANIATSFPGFVDAARAAGLTLAVADA